MIKRPDMSYVPLKELAGKLRLKEGERVFVTSDVKRLLYSLIENGDQTDLNILIDGIMDIIGPKGCLVFPTFNWSFCKGVAYDHIKTPCKTGSLGKLALERPEFRRTKHPIYSFAVWGEGADELCAFENKSSFGIDSPFTYLMEKDFNNLFIDKDLQHSFVFVHYVEENNGPVPYRYLKDFTADYTDENGVTTVRTYSMNVRDLDMDVQNRIYPYEPDFKAAGIEEQFYINGIEYKKINLRGAYPIIARDVRENRSRKLCRYIGQEDESATGQGGFEDTESVPCIEEGREMYSLACRIFPICRSITGDGVRETFSILKEYMPDIRLSEVPTGTKVFDWTIPKEWNIEEAYLEDESGERIVDFKDNNLHVVGYSVPVDEVLSLEELLSHIYSLEGQPDVIPYVTSYYKERWGFCMTHRQKESLRSGKYHAVIRSSLREGSLTYGEMYFPGESEKEVFFSSYVCHPSMGNNECSGQALIIWLARYIKSMKNRRYSYRLVLAPETIGAITYLSRHLEELKKNVIAGFNLTCVGDDRDYSIVHSRYGDTYADKVLMNALRFKSAGFSEYPYTKRGSDERQYQAPGVDIPLVCFCRSKYHIFPEYHTSADDLSLISPEGLAGSFDVMVKCIEAIENNAVYKTACLCEPQLGRRGLMPTVSSKETYQETLALKDVVAYADGRNDLIDLSNIIEQPVSIITSVINKLITADLVEKVSDKQGI